MNDMMIDPQAVVLRDRLLALAAEPLDELDKLSKGDTGEVARENGRYEAARSALIAWIATFGQVAEFQAPNVADIIIANYRRER